MKFFESCGVFLKFEQSCTEFVEKAEKIEHEAAFLQLYNFKNISHFVAHDNQQYNMHILIKMLEGSMK